MRSRRALFVPIAALLLLTGCFTGKRPSFAHDRFGPLTSTGDPAIDAVLAKFDQATFVAPTFTATYDIVVRFGNVDKKATVAVDGTNRSVTIGDAQLLQSTDRSRTCRATLCTPGLDPTAISDTQLTIDFWAADTAKRLRIDATSKVGPTAQRAEQVADQSASCVDVAQANNNTVTYCVLDDGVLARLADADVYVTLTSFSPTVAPDAFQGPN